MIIRLYIKAALVLSALALNTPIGLEAQPIDSEARATAPNTVRLEFSCSRFSNRELYEFAGLPRSQTPTERIPLIVEKVFTALAHEGYPFAALDSVNMRYNKRSNVIIIHIDTGKPAFLSAVDMDGGDFTDLDGLAGKQLSESLIVSRAIEMLENLTDEGYPFARITVLPRHLREEEDVIAADLDFHVDKGSFTRLRRIGFPDAMLTRERLLKLESRLHEREVFTRSALLRAQERLERLEFIDNIGEPRLITTGAGWIDLELTVSERRVNTLTAVFSAAAGNDNPTGEVRINFGNILGTGRRLRLEWLGLDPDRSGILAAYREPWLLGRPVHADLELEQWTADTLQTTTRYMFGLDWEPVDRLTLSGAIAQENIGSDADSLQTNLASRSTWIEGGLTYDRLDRTWNPNRGYRLKVRSATGRRRWIDSDRDPSKLRREVLSVELAQPLYRRFVMYEKLATRDISGEDVLFEDLIRFGGAGTVRGYPEAGIFARGATWGSMEARWRPDRDSYLGLFADIGYVYRRDDTIKPREEVPLGFGITAGLITKAGRLELDLGLAKGEPLQNARLHVRLEGWF